MQENENNIVPVILLDKEAYDFANIFDPNQWETTESKSIIYSAWSEFSVLKHCCDQLSAMCLKPQQYIDRHIKSIERQWELSKFNLSRTQIYGQHINLHIYIEAFFSSVKSFLDIIVQLIASEKIVRSEIRGFNRVKKNYGGKVIKALKNNSVQEKKQIAIKIELLINNNKSNWIDQLINVRDIIIHPMKGMSQMMFYLKFEEDGKKLVCSDIHSPVFNSVTIDMYARDTFEKVKEFTVDFLELLK